MVWQVVFFHFEPIQWKWLTMWNYLKKSELLILKFTTLKQIENGKCEMLHVPAQLKLYFIYKNQETM
jgi:hypothetical protein